MKELLDLYGDPEAHFLDIASPTSDIYRRNSLAQLKKDYEQLKAGTIAEVFFLQVIKKWSLKMKAVY